MKNLRKLFTAFLLLSSVLVAAEEVTIDGITYNVVTKAKSATVTVSDMGYSGEIVIPSEIIYNDVVCSVTGIGDNAFYKSTELVNVVIPNSVVSIGMNTFSKCDKLTSIDIPNSVTDISSGAFSHSLGLLSMEIPNSVTSIGAGAFSGCSNLVSVKMSDNVTVFAHELFNNCYNLKEINIGKNVTSLELRAFGDCSKLAKIIIPDNVTTIGDNVFDGCNSLKDITIGEGVTSIGSYAFDGCVSLENITLPDKITKINQGLFTGCTALKSISIPDGVTTIAGYAFYGCKNLETVKIGKSVSVIYLNAFTNCEKLKDVYCYAVSVPNTDKSAFYNSYPEYMTLYVPEEAINNYKAAAPWNTFGSIVTLNGEEVEAQKCATPVISYNNCGLDVTCETVGAECVTTVTCRDAKTFNDTRINFTATYEISTYATLSGYDNSDIAEAILCWVEKNDVSLGVIEVEATPVLITSVDGNITLKGVEADTEVVVYDVNGIEVGTTVANGGDIVVSTTLANGAVAVVKIGNKAVKVVID